MLIKETVKSKKIFIIPSAIIIVILGLILYGYFFSKPTEQPQIQQPTAEIKQENEISETLDYSILKAEKDEVTDTETYYILLEQEKPSENQLKSLSNGDFRS